MVHFFVGKCGLLFSFFGIKINIFYKDLLSSFKFIKKGSFPNSFFKQSNENKTKIKLHKGLLQIKTIFF